MKKNTLTLNLGAFCAVIAAMSVASAQAQQVEDANLLNGATVTAISTFGNPAFNAAHITDGTVASHVFADGQGNDQDYAISGFSAPGGIPTLRFFDEPQFSERIAIDVTVWYSPNDYSGQSAAYQLDQANYLGGVFYDLPSIAVVNDLGTEDYFQIPTNPLQFSTTFGSPSARAIHYADIAVNLPAGTQSILLQTTPSSIFTGQGAGLTEIQAVPEPTSMALLLGAGMVALSLRRNRK
jgi:hypothetical protein